ncbi:MAG: hypothetical protein N3A66_02985 [Planctomycetota bacterium]|nr:hypothetical protein [Planctomycetota bacterium]
MSEYDCACQPSAEKPMPLLLDFDRRRLAAALAELGAPAYRGEQLWRWLHRRVADSYDAMSDLPRALRQALAARYALRRFRIADHLVSADGLTEKWRLIAAAATAPAAEPGIETVLIREQRGARRTV